MSTPLLGMAGRTAENRHMDDAARIPPGGERRARHVLQQPLPAPARASKPLPVVRSSTCRSNISRAAGQLSAANLVLSFSIRRLM